jgi:hypothetical protein
MSAKIIEFPGAAQPESGIAQFIRIGESHGKIGDLLSMGRLPASRVVFKASRLKHQKYLISEFRERGIETVLDPQTAELGSIRKFDGQERHAPWGRHCNGKPLGFEFFKSDSTLDVVGEIARTAIEYGFDTVLSPTHFLGNDDLTIHSWLSSDRNSCAALRRALDREGGKEIAIDFPIILPMRQFQRDEIRSEILSSFDGLPVDHAWLRISGAEGKLLPQATRRLLMLLGGLQNLGVPLILDHLGGPASLAALAFGVASGRAIGIGEMERFDATEWDKRPPVRSEDEKFGRASRFSIDGFGGSLTRNEVQFLAEARGGRKLLAHGLRDVAELLANGREVQIEQVSRVISDLEAVPAHRRADWFVSNEVPRMVRVSQQLANLKPPKDRAAELKINSDSLMERLREHSSTISKSLIALEALKDSRSDSGPRARPAKPSRIIEKARKWEQQ